MSRTRPAGRAMLAAAALAAGAAAGAPVHAASKSFIARYGQWQAHKAQIEGAAVCYAAAMPIRQQGKYKRRGETSLIVSFWPARKVSGQVEVRAGYTYRAGGPVTLTFNNGTKFTLRTVADGAWSRNGAEDRKIVKNLADRARLTVTGRSSRGTRTVDTYSLKGFRAAFARAKSACGM